MKECVGKSPPLPGLQVTAWLAAGTLSPGGAFWGNPRLTCLCVCSASPSAVAVALGRLLHFLQHVGVIPPSAAVRMGRMAGGRVLGPGRPVVGTAALVFV